MAVVTPFTGPHTDTADLLAATLAFEAIVDAVIHFDVRIGLISSPKMAPPARQAYRARVAQLLNERAPQIDSAAVLSATEVLRRRHATLSGCNAPDMADTGAAIVAYRDHLRASPVPTIGVIR